MEFVQLPKLLLGYVFQTLKTKDVISLGDTCKTFREIAQFELNKRKNAYFERFTYPGTKWDFRGMWSVPYEIFKNVPEEQKPSLYKRVGCPGYPFEQAVKELEEACKKGDTGTYQLGWTALTKKSSLIFIKANWETYPWCIHGLTNHPEFSWEDVVEHPERYSFSTLSLNHPDAYKMAIQYPHLPWDKHFLGKHHCLRSTELTVERMIQLNIQPKYDVYDYPCVSIEDILNHPELNWESKSSISHHRDLTIDILKKYPQGLPPEGWHPELVTGILPVKDILENPDVFPWDSKILEERLQEKKHLSTEEIVDNILHSNANQLEYIIHMYPIPEVLAVWNHPEAKPLIIDWYEYYNEYERECDKDSMGKDLCHRKDFTFDILLEHINDPHIEWDWEYLTEKASLEFIHNHPTVPWCNYTLSRREDLTWEFVKEHLSTFEWSWENLGYNKNMFKHE